MIYFVTGRPVLFKEEYNVQFCSVEVALKLLQPLQIISLDTETRGLDAHTKALLAVQMGCKDFQVVVDCETINIDQFKAILEDPKRLFILQNAKFDLQFFYHKRILISQVYDTFLAEKLLYLGYPPGMHSASLYTMGLKYCNIELDKSIRGEIITKGFTQRVIQYAADDVKYLEEIMEKQQLELQAKDLLNALSFENSFVKVLAYIEYCGVKLDADKWKLKIQQDKLRLIQTEELLNQWVITHFAKDKRFCAYPLMNDLFNPIDMTKPYCKLNWQSSKQLIPLFETLGYSLEVVDKEKGGIKKSIEGKVLKMQPNVSTILPLYLEYAAAAKIVSTYGESFLLQINKKTGRIHTKFTQLMDTGRLSSGGKDKVNKVEYVNLQNIPHDAETRSCFIVEPNHKWLSADYKGQESVILANVSQDEAILDLLRKDGDLHSLVAKMVYPKELEGIAVEDVKEKRKDLRNKAKGPEFLFGYGGNADTLHATTGIPLEEAKEIEANYRKGFKGVARYQDWARSQVMKDGFVLLNPITKHKSYIYDFPKLKEISSQFTQEFWAQYRVDKAAGRSTQAIEDVKYYFKRKSAAEKASINYRIQGTGACTFKLASILLFDELKKRGWLFKVKYTIPVHDEINLEAPNEIAEEVGKVLVKCMRVGGAYFCRVFPLDADINIGNCWIH